MGARFRLCRQDPPGEASRDLPTEEHRATSPRTHGFHLVATAPVVSECLLFSGCCGCQLGWIVKTLMGDATTWEDRTALFGIITHCDDVVERLAQHFGDTLAGVPGDVDADLRHHLNRARIEVLCRDAR